MAYLYSHSLKKLEELNLVTSIYEADSEIPDPNFNIKIAIYEKYFIISLYTLWDNSNIDALKKIFLNYPLLFNKQDFIFKHLESVFLNNKLKKKLKSEVTNSTGYDFNTINIENMIDSNNLWFKNLKELLSLYNFNIDILPTYFYNSPDIKQAITLLESSSIEPYSNNGNKPSDGKKLLYYQIEGYINYLVDTRNSYSHKYKKPYSVFSINEFNYLYQFISSTISALDTYLKEQILLNCINDNIETYLTPLRLSDLSILYDKKKNDEFIEITFSVLEEYNIERQNRVILFNSRKDIHNQINIFEINEVYEVRIDGSYDKQDETIITLYKGRPYKIKLKDISKKRKISRAEHECIQLYID